MRVFLFFLLIFLPPYAYADNFICLTKNFEDRDTYIYLDRIDQDTYLFTQTFDVDSNNSNKVTMKAIQDTREYLTLAVAANEMSFTIHIDRKENYFELTHITLFVERELEKLVGACILN